MSEEIKISKKDSVACNYWKACDYYKQLKRLEKENEELKNRKDDYYVKTLDQEAQISDLIQENEELKHTLEEIRGICKCSKEMNCEECPECDDCEELCANDENLQNILIDIINKVLESEGR